MAGDVTNLKTFQKANEMLRILRTAVHKSQEENRRRGIPNVYSIHGRLHYELPSGELTTTPPPSYSADSD